MSWNLVECYEDRFGHEFWHVRLAINGQPYWSFGADKYDALWNAVAVLNTYGCA